MSTNPGKPQGIQVIDRAANVLSTVVHADEPMSFAELVEECGLPKSTTSRLLTSLESAEMLERDGGGSYVAGPLFWLYAARHDPWDEFARLVHPMLVRIGDEIRETVNLAATRGDRVVHIDQVESQYLLGTRDWTQVVDTPTHASALGKVLCAWGCLELPTGRLERCTDETVTDRSVLQRQFERIRRRGWSATVDELEVGLSAVAVPLRGANGDVVAALGVSGPTVRIEERTTAIGRKLCDRADQLSRMLQRRSRKEGVA